MRFLAKIFGGKSQADNQTIGEAVQINEHEGSLKRPDPGALAGVKKRSDFVQKQLIDNMLGAEGFVKVSPQKSGPEEERKTPIKEKENIASNSQSPEFEVILKEEI